MKRRPKKYSDEEIILGIKNKDEYIIKYIYNSLLPVVKSYVTKNSGDEFNAEDLFQEALIIIFDKARKDVINLTCNFNTYFVAICKKLWLNELRKKSYRFVSHLNDIELYLCDDSYNSTLHESEFRRLFFKHFNRMSIKSQQILVLHFKKTPPARIAIILGYKNKEYAISRKYKCLKSLISSIKSDPILSSINIDNERIELF